MVQNRLSLYFFLILTALITSFQSLAQTQTLQDDFEGNGSINAWATDDCLLELGTANPSPGSQNPSAKVLRYQDVGGQYANIRFDIPLNFNLSSNHTFTLKLFVPSSGITGNSANQISLKLQNGSTESPWASQCEIIKPIVLNQWQLISFNFVQDAWLNFDPASPPPAQRIDFNRVLIQINGENNNSQVLAFIDDFTYDGAIAYEPNYNNLIWADEFEGNGAVDDGRWFLQTQLPAGGGGSWYNGELQHYTNRLENSSVSNGTLKITARRELFTDQGQTKSFTSARLNSKFAFTYGKVEFSAKLPSAPGTWPAFWLLGKNIISEDGAYWQAQGFGNTPWPACGEIDVMEHWGNNPNFVQSAIHTPSSFGATVNKGGKMLPTAFSEFHTYSMEWYPTRLIFKVDGIVHYIYNPQIRNSETWPFTLDQYLLLNLAIEQGIAGNFSEDVLELDYVRIYRGSPTSTKPVFKENEIQVFPNPALSRLRLNLAENLNEEVILQLQSPDGRQTLNWRQMAHGNSIELQDLSSLPYGLYIGFLATRNGRLPFKFVKE